MRKMLFFDDHLLNRQRNITRRYHEPAWIEDSLYLDRVTPYGVCYGTVSPAVGGGWLMHYVTVLNQRRKVLGAARSDDAVHWEPVRLPKPRVSDHLHYVYPPDGVLHGSGLCVYHDAREADPSRRYKMVDPVHAADGQYIRINYSADGINWEPQDDHRVLARGSDTMLSLLRNPRTGRLQIHMREWTGDRRVFRVDSADGVSWTPPQLVLHPSPLDQPMTQFYGLPQCHYGDMLLGLLWVYHTPFSTESHLRHDGWVDTELVYSYDGLTWNRTHRPFMPRRQWGQFGGGSQYGCAMVVRENDLLVYSAANVDEHQHVRARGSEPALGMLAGSLRLDGFVSLTTRDGGIGEAYTDCLYLRSPMLSLNARVPYGAIRVGVCDVNCKPLPGYGLDDCLPVTGDGVRLQPRWREHQDLSAAMQLAAATEWPGWVRLHVELDRADLFAIQGDFGLFLRSGAPGRDWL